MVLTNKAYIDNIESDDRQNCDHYSMLYTLITLTTLQIITYINNNIKSEHWQICDHGSIFAWNLSMLNQLVKVLLGNACKQKYIC